MGSKLTGRAWRYLADSGRALERAPAEVTIALCVAVAFSYAVEAGGDAFPRWLEIAVAGVLMGAAAWTATLLHGLGVWSARTRWAVTLAGAVAAGLYGGLVADFDRAAEAWRAAMLVSAALLWLAAAPVLAARSAARRTPSPANNGGVTEDAVYTMRSVTGRFLLRVLGALLYCAALFAGLALAIGAVNTLFELRLDGEIFAHVFGWIFIVLAPWIIVGGLPEYVAPVPVRAEVASVVHRMTAFLVPPLLVLYNVILYAYTIRIAVTGEVPKNIVSPMVFAAGALALLALLLFDPRSGGTTGDRTLRLAPPVFVPLAALGAWTILMRVEQYGWTEFRLLRLALLIAFGLLALGASVQLVRGARLPLHIAPLALAALLVLAAIGPWSVLNVSQRSQQSRLDRALGAAGVVPSEPRSAPAVPDALWAAPALRPVGAGMPADSARPLAAEVFDQINSTAGYLVQHFGPQSLPPALSAIAAVPDHRYNMAGALGFRRMGPVQPEHRYLFAQLAGEASINVDEVTAHRVFTGPRRSDGTAGNAVLQPDGHALRIHAAGEVFTADLAPLLAAAALLPERQRELTQAEARLTVHDERGVDRGSLLVLEMNAEQTQAGATTLHMLNGVLLVRASR